MEETQGMVLYTLIWSDFDLDAMEVKPPKMMVAIKTGFV